jgi:hypothetical protein
VSGDLSLHHAVNVNGGETVLKCLVDKLLECSGSTDFLSALDLIGTLVCTSGLRQHLQLRLANLGQLLKQRESLRAEAIVHLCRCVESYSSLLVVQDVNMDIGNLPEIETSTIAPGPIESTQQPVDDIDQVLNESAAMNAMDTNLGDALDGGMNVGDDLDSFYLQDDNMGLGNLDDLDLDMF